jgi:hypothetical protein
MMAYNIVKIRNISFVIFLVGLLLFLIGFGAPYWMMANDDEIEIKYHEGIWKRCWDGPFNDRECWNPDPAWTGELD